MIARLGGSFAEMCERAISVDEVHEVFMREIAQLGFTHAACASHVDPLKPPQGAVVMLDYPPAWVAYFSERGLWRRDPVFNTARSQALPFKWTDRRFRKSLSPDQLVILQEAAEFGLGDGFTIPIHAPDALPASCSLAFGADGVDPLAIREAHWVAVYAHENARRILLDLRPPAERRLSPRERECVEWFARGKSDYEIGVIIGVSEHTVHNTVRRVLKKYGVATRIQAFARALRDREILVEDVFS